MKPQRMPWVMEKVNGIRMIVKNAGRPSSILEKEIWPTLRNMDAPTRIKTDAVANAGTMPANGARKKHGRKHTAVKTEVKPVRPPMLMPAMLSIYAVPEDVPASPAPSVANESTT